MRGLRHRPSGAHADAPRGLETARGPALRVPTRRVPLRGCLSLAAWLGSMSACAAAEPALSIERLNSEGWEIAGYTGTFDNRSSLILFRKRDRTYLVQCSILYDVTRSPRVITNCYELH